MSITPNEYDAAVARGTGLHFICLRCRHNDTYENGDILDFNDSGSSVSNDVAMEIDETETTVSWRVYQNISSHLYILYKEIMKEHT